MHLERVVIGWLVASAGCGATKSAPPSAPRVLPACASSSTSPDASVDAAAESAVAKPSRDLLALGVGHTCVSSLPADGVFCFGDNRRGQSAAKGPRASTPVRVLDHGVTSLAAGAEHTCADAFCWGRNDAGQLGDGTHVDRARPTLAKELFEDPAAFFDPDHPFQWVLLASGSWAVRTAEYGYEHRHAGLVPHVGLTCAPGIPCTQWFVSASSHGDTLCAQLAGYGGVALSSLYCSEEHALLERGFGEGDDLQPHLGTLHGPALGRRFACAVRLDQRIECWGDLHGLRGDGNTKRSTWISGYWSATTVVVGETYGCFVRVDDRVACFGTEPAMGLDRAGIKAGSTPISMSDPASEGGGRVAALAAGSHHACAVLATSGATVACWGKNDQGQLGDGTTKDAKAPVRVTLLP